MNHIAALVTKSINASSKPGLYSQLLLLLLFCSAQVFAEMDQPEMITLKLKNVSLKELFRMIEKQTPYHFYYSDDIVPPQKTIAITVRDAPLRDVLEKVLSPYALSWKMTDANTIVILSNNKPVPVPVAGTIVNEKGEPMAGVTVSEKNTSNAVTTDQFGKFKMEVSSGTATLLITNVGYEAVELKVGTGGTLQNIVMKTADKTLDDVIVVGYGKQSKRLVTGTIASVDLKPLATSPVTNVNQALRGRVAGVIFSDNGRPGQDRGILIRGKRSITATNDPLIIVDGSYFNGSLNDISPQDVESMDILKDASSAAIYGARGANGVILITTKTGKTSKPTIRFNTFYAHNEPSREMTLLTPERYIQRILDWRSQTGQPADPNNINTYLKPSEAKNLAAGVSVDPYDYISQNSYTASYDLSLSGKTDRVNYFISGSLADEKGLISNDNSKRLTLRSNLEVKPLKWIALGVMAQYTNRDLSGKEPDNMGNAYLTSPLATLKDSSGAITQFAVPEDNLVANPLYVSSRTVNEEINNNLFANIYTEITPAEIPGLSLRINYTPSFRWNHNFNAYKRDFRLPNNDTYASKVNVERFEWNLENILTYKKQINDDHNFDITLLYGRSHWEYTLTEARGNTLPNDLVLWNNLAQAATQLTRSEATLQEGISSMARLNYQFRSKYLVTLTARRDGSSVFAANNKFATFPSVAVGWVISEENFMKNVKFVDQLKLRLSYASAGNQGILPYQSLALTSTSQYVFGDGGPTSTGISASSMANPNLKWETTYNKEFGLDFMLFNGRLGGTFGLYDLQTKNLLIRRSIPTITGFSSILFNVGETNNRGFELTLNTVNIRKKDFQWSSNFNMSRNWNKIVHIYKSDANGDGKEDDDIDNRWFIGQPQSTIFGYAFNGVYQEGETMPAGYKAGWARIQDNNKDGLVTAADRQFLGQEDAKFFWGLNNSFTYKNFSFCFFLKGQHGGLQIYDRLMATVGTSHYIDRPTNFQDLGWWTPQNKSNDRTGLSYVNPFPGTNGFHTYVDRNFVTLQDISLSYDLPKDFLQKIKTQAAKIYVSGRNVYTWTNYPGLDPESGDLYYPVPRAFSIGLSLTF